jgi:hypothetical protein
MERSEEELKIEQAAKDLARSILKIKSFNIPEVTDRKRYVADAAMVYLSQPFRDIITQIQREQMEFIILNSDIGQVGKMQELVSRGTINGADLIEARMKMLYEEHLRNAEETPKLNADEQYSVINPLD